MTDSTFTIKFATKNDVAVVLSFIKELAIYLKLIQEGITTEELLSESFFGDNKHAEAIIGYYDQEPIGCALFFHNFSTPLGRPGLYLEDLYVKPEMRRRGYGKKFLVFLAKLAKERKCARFEWLALSSDQTAINFYKKDIGAREMSDWRLFRLSGKALDELAELAD